MAGSEVWEELGRGGERWLVERKFAEGEVIGQGDLRQGVVGWREEVRGGLRARSPGLEGRDLRRRLGRRASQEVEEVDRLRKEVMEMKAKMSAMETNNKMNNFQFVMGHEEVIHVGVLLGGGGDGGVGGETGQGEAGGEHDEAVFGGGQLAL